MRAIARAQSALKAPGIATQRWFINVRRRAAGVVIRDGIGRRSELHEWAGGESWSVKGGLFDPGTARCFC